MGIKGSNLNFEELSKIGVKRISLGASLYRTAITGFIESILHIKKNGQFDYVEQAINAPELNKIIDNI
jgi:2-methylisocitrate lyase-like PEP mutase family enzyme